jgi:hypothetical protein
MVTGYIAISVRPNGKILKTDMKPTLASANRALAAEKRKAGIKPTKKTNKPSK